MVLLRARELVEATIQAIAIVIQETSVTDIVVVTQITGGIMQVIINQNQIQRHQALVLTRQKF